MLESILLQKLCQQITAKSHLIYFFVIQVQAAVQCSHKG